MRRERNARGKVAVGLALVLHVINVWYWWCWRGSSDEWLETWDVALLGGSFLLIYAAFCLHDWIAFRLTRRPGPAED